jgi:hypothetical protein
MFYINYVSASTRTAIEWQPTGERQRGKFRKQWMDGIRKDLETLETTD